MRADLELRPLPERVVLVAFPDAASARTSIASAAPDGDFLLVQAPSSDVVLLGGTHSWLKLRSPVALSNSLCMIGYRADANDGAARSGDVEIAIHGRRYTVEFVQQAGELIRTELVGTLNCPLVIEGMVATCYTASLIKKVSPPPLKLLALLAAAIAIVLSGLAASIARRAFPEVPEPWPLSLDTGGVQISLVPDLPLSMFPMGALRAEDQTIALQSLRAIYWLIEQVLSS